MIVDTVDRQTIRAAVELGSHAPSLHNSQPWRWRLDGRSLLLQADLRRWLPATDADGATWWSAAARPCTTRASRSRRRASTPPCIASPTRSGPMTSPRSNWLRAVPPTATSSSPRRSSAAVPTGATSPPGTSRNPCKPRSSNGPPSRARCSA